MGIVQIILIAKVFGIKVNIDFTAEINVGKLAKEVFDQVLQVITKLPQKIQEEAEALLTNAKNAAQNTWNNAKNSVENSLTEAGDSVIKAFEDAANAVKEEAEKAANAVKETAEKAANAVKENDVVGGIFGNRRRKGWGGRRLLEKRFRARRLLWSEKLAEQKVRVSHLGDKDADISLVDWEWEAENSAKLVVARIRHDEHMGIKSEPPSFLELPASYFVEGAGRLVTGKSHQKARANWAAIKPSS